jgi:hypothetical protein
MLNGDPTPVTPDASGNAAAAPAPAATPAPFDTTAFESRLKEVDPSWTLDSFVDHAKNMRQTLSTQGREYTQMKQNFERVRPLLEAADADDELRSAIDDTIRTHYDSRSGQGRYAQPTPTNLTAGLDPVRNEMNQLKTDVVIMRMEGQLSELAEKGFPMDQVRRDAVMTRVLDSGWGNVRDHYMSLYGDEIIAAREAAAASKAAEAAQRNAGAYRPVGSTNQPSGHAPNVAAMSEAEADTYAIGKIRELGIRSLPKIGNG